MYEEFMEDDFIQEATLSIDMKINLQHVLTRISTNTYEKEYKQYLVLSAKCGKSGIKEILEKVMKSAKTLKDAIANSAFDEIRDNIQQFKMADRQRYHELKDRKFYMYPNIFTALDDLELYYTRYSFLINRLKTMA